MDGQDVQIAILLYKDQPSKFRIDIENTPHHGYRINASSSLIGRSLEAPLGSSADS